MFGIILYLLFIIIQAVIFYEAPANKRVNYFLAWFIFFQLFVISAFRHPSILNDTQAYIDSFKVIDARQSFWCIEGRYEPGFQIFMKFIFRYISTSPLALLTIASFITQGLFVWFMYKNSNLLWFSFFLYITFRLFFFSASGIRQGIAVGICLLAYEFLKESKLKYYFSLIILAFLFHYSAAFFLVLYFIRKIDVKLKMFLIIGLATFVIFIFIAQLSDILFIFFSYGKDYYDQGIELESNLGAIFITFNIAIIFFFVYNSWYRKLNKISDADRIQLWALFIALIIQILSIKFGILIRFTYYFLPFSLILLLKAIGSIKNKEIKYFSLMFWVIYSSAQFLIILYYRPDWYNFYPYKFYWE